jgi:hypothetical protein
MTKSLWIAALTLAAITPASPALAGEQYLSTSLSGTVQSLSHSGPSNFQVGPAATTEGNPALNGAPGIFTSYTASAGLPQLTGSDLSKYGWALYATLGSVSGNVANYSGTFRIYAPGYGYSVNDGQILEHGSFTATATFTNPFDANVTGVFLADVGSLQPPGWPVPVDFSAANPGIFNGTFTSSANGAQFLTGTLTTVPEPASLSLAGVCLGGLALQMWRKRRAAV